jgi:putrescine aminotransferase
MNSSVDSATLKALDRAHHLHPFTDFHDYADRRRAHFQPRRGRVHLRQRRQRMLDGMSGLWCCNLGYSQDAIKQAVFEQMQQLPYYNNFFKCSNQPAVELAGSADGGGTGRL